MISSAPNTHNLKLIKMLKKAAGIFRAFLVLGICCCASGQDIDNANPVNPAGTITASAPVLSVVERVESVKTDVVAISVEQQYQAVRPGGASALAIHFKLDKDWHFYASAKTAPGQVNLKIKPSADGGYINFSEPVFPGPQLYFDKSSDKRLNVFSNEFTVFVPFIVNPVRLKPGESISTAVKIDIAGAVCSDVQCRMPNFGQLSINVKIAGDAPMSPAKFTLPIPTQTSASLWFALGLAILAGLGLNIMPCVWPVLPIIVMRLVEQAKQSRSKSAVMGLAFCLGILLFFACLAAANVILQVFYGTVLQWGDQFRSPAFVAAMALLLVAMAMFMFGIFTIGLPSSIAGKSESAGGFTGAVGMGFLAAILSTPCSFGILAVAFAWAQAQPLPLGTIAIMVIGLGMSLPYAILTSMPGLLKRMPRAGRWMELFRQTTGFVLLIIAVKLITALPQVQRTGVLYFAVILSFCVWMWGGWVGYNTRLLHKWLIRIIAAALAVTAGLIFLPAPADELIDWQPYNAVLIEQSVKEQRPVLIKFTADWCLSCQVAEKTVYARRDIADLVREKNVLAVRADTTVKDSPATLALKNVYGEPGVPVTILLAPGGKEPLRWRGLAFGDELKAALEKL